MSCIVKYCFSDFVESNNRPLNNAGRRTSSSSITSESVKKARQVYCAKQPKPRYYSAGVTHSSNTATGALSNTTNISSNSSSISSLRGGSGGPPDKDETTSSIQPTKTISSNKNSNQPNNSNHSRTMSLSPMKRNNNKTSKSPTPAVQKGHQSLRNGGPKIAKPVIKPPMRMPILIRGSIN